MPSIDATNWSAFSPLPATDSRKIALSAADDSQAATRPATAAENAKPQQPDDEATTQTQVQSAPSAQEN